MDERLVLTVSEAASVLRLSRAFTYELVARGQLPAVRFGRRNHDPPGGDSAHRRRLPSHAPAISVTGRHVAQSNHACVTWRYCIGHGVSMVTPSEPRAMPNSSRRASCCWRSTTELSLAIAAD
jgi:excisionase family DNA binding protein